MDCIVHGVAKSWTQLNDFHSLYSGALEMLVAPNWGPPSGAVLGREGPDL